MLRILEEGKAFGRRGVMASTATKRQSEATYKTPRRWSASRAFGFAAWRQLRTAWYCHLDGLSHRTCGSTSCPSPRCTSSTKPEGLLYFVSLSASYFQKAVSLVGTDPKSGKLWDNYVMYETSCVGFVSPWNRRTFPRRSPLCIVAFSPLPSRTSRATGTRLWLSRRSSRWRCLRRRRS